MHRISTALVVSFGLLSGCGGGGGGGSESDSDGGGNGNSVTQNPFDLTESFFAGVDDGSIELEPVSVDDLPNSANMSGAFFIGVEDADFEAAGEASATANFAAGTLTGQADGFVQYDESGNALQDYDGTLAINGNIVDTSFDFTATGELTATDSTIGPASVDVDLPGAGTVLTANDVLTAFGTSSGPVDVTSGGTTESLDAFGILILQR